MKKSNLRLNLFIGGIVAVSGLVGYFSEYSVLHGVRVSKFANILLCCFGLIYIGFSIFDYLKQSKDNNIRR